ncbi:hypothetical protein SDJN03_08964, partial [Cucurbita argyrosperma subsp. sororia]
MGFCFFGRLLEEPFNGVPFLTIGSSLEYGAEVFMFQLSVPCMSGDLMVGKRNPMVFSDLDTVQFGVEPCSLLLESLTRRLPLMEDSREEHEGRCKFCGQSYCIGTATGNLRRHLSNRHPGYDKSGDIITEKYKAVIRGVFRSIQEDLRASLEHVSSKISVTLDFWDSYDQISFRSVTCQWIDESWSFQKVLLDIFHVPYPRGGLEIFHSIVKVLKTYNIEGRILSCTHDNSQDAMHACHALKEHLDGQKVGRFCYIPCVARTLNSILDDGLRPTKAIIPKVREFVLEMNACLDISEDFVRFSTVYQEANWKFPLDCSVRWSGNYQMLDIVRKGNPWKKYEETLSSPDHISETIAACRDSRHNPDWLKTAAEDMAKKAKNYSHQVCNISRYMASILDPRIKVELLPEILNSGNHLEEARSHFIRHYSSNHFPSLTSSYSAHEIEDGESVCFAEEIARKKRRASTSNTSDELTQYLSEPPAPIATDVLEWWKVNSTRYPRLSVMARDFLAVQATSVAPEDLFCRRGDDVEKQRYCMLHDTTPALLYIKSWIQSGFRMTYKSNEIEYEMLIELAATSIVDSNSAASDKKSK